MLLHLTEDEHGWVVEPHGTESECWSTTPEGSEQLKKAGWRPYVLPRVNRNVIESMIIDGWLTLLAFKTPATPSQHRENQPGIQLTSSLAF